MYIMPLCVISYRSSFIEDKMLNLNDKESLMQTVDPVDLQLDMTENDKEHLFDLE